MLIGLSRSSVQNYIVKNITTELSEKLKTTVSINNVEFRLFNTFRLHHFYIEDLQKDTLLFVESVDTKISLPNLLRKRIVINGIEINRLNGKYIVDANGKTNFQFVIDAFKGKKRKEKSSASFEMQVKNIQIKNSFFVYQNHRSLQNINKNKFNTSDIALKNINLDLDINYFKEDSVRATIRNISCFEKSGLSLKNMKAKISGLKKGIDISDWTIILPNSEIEIDDFSIKYDTIFDLNDFANSVKIKGKILSSKIFLPDFTAFLPELKQLNKTAQISGKLQGRMPNIRVSDFLFQYENNTWLQANVDLSGITDINETFIFADIERLQLNKADMQDAIAKLLNEPFELPQALNQLGNVRYKGNISGFFSNLVSYGNIFTNLGNIRTDISVKISNKMQDIRYSGSISSSNFQLGRLLSNKNFGKTSFTIKTEGDKLAKSSLNGLIKGTLKEFYFQNYLYENIQLDGHYDRRGFDGKMVINDENIGAKFHGLVDISGKIPHFNFDLKVKNANLNKLKIVEKYENIVFSFNGNAKLQGNSIDEIDGSVLINNLKILNKENQFVMDKLKVEMFNSDSTYTNLIIKSNLISGVLNGKFKYSTLKNSILSSLHQYIPSLISKTQTTENNYNQFQLEVKINPLENLSNILNLPFTTHSTSFITSFFDNKNDEIDFRFSTPNLIIKKREFKNINFDLNNQKKRLDISLKGNYKTQKNLFRFNINNQIALDSIFTQIDWKNAKGTNYFGKIQTETSFEQQTNFLKTNIRVLPTQMIFSDTIWNVYPTNIKVLKDSLITVEHWKIAGKNQSLITNGFLSKNKKDVLNLDLKNIELGFVLDLLNLDVIDIDGKASGSVNIYQALQKPILEADIYSKDTYLNNVFIGDGQVTSQLNQYSNELLVSGHFKDKKGEIAKINGSYQLKSDSIDFLFDVKRLNIAFLHKWFNSIFKDMNGMGTGLIRMFGNSHNISFEGNTFIKDAELTLDFLHTTYSFTDTVFLKRKSIELKNVVVYDDEKNRGIANALVTHNGYLKDFNYNLNFQAYKMKVLDKVEKDEIPFYGKGYMTGRVNIFGSQKEATTHININGKSEKNTKLYIFVENNKTVSDNHFITFVHNRDSVFQENKKLETITTKRNNLLLKASLSVTPEAEIELLLNPQSGDKISSTGAGNIRLEINSLQKDFNIYGNYTIDKGDFFFSLEDLITKAFKIERGSSIAWSGDVMKANLDINAIYSLTASLSDLVNMNMISNSTNRTSIPVNCILHLENELTNPKISFGIDLPSSDETLKMQVKNLMNTEDLLNRQVLYLLLFNKFYTSNKQTETNNNNGQEWELLNSILTGQISSWLSKLNKNVTFGLNYRTSRYGQDVSQEYETTVMYRPNNRLIMNGNFGYRNDQLVKDKMNKIIGDVNIEYVLTDNRKWRIKAYNHTVDRYSLRSVPFVQGVGIMYKQDFDNWRELWNDLLKKKQREVKNDSITKKKTKK